MSSNQSKVLQQRFWKKWRDSGAVGALSFNEQKHHELREGEVFVANSDPKHFHHIGWMSKRAGESALDQLGRTIRSRAWPDAFPVFADIDELASKGVVIEYKPKAVSYFPPL